MNDEIFQSETNKLGRYFTKSDKITMIINFKENQGKWHLNDDNEALLKYRMTTNVVYPFFALYWKECGHEMTNYCFK